MQSWIGKGKKGWGDDSGGILIGNSQPLVKELQKNKYVGKMRAREALLCIEMHKRGKAPPLTMDYYNKIKRLVKGVQLCNNSGLYY